MSNDNIILRKVPLDKLISVLVEMYNHGVDFIDISGVPGEEQDTVAISFTKEYMTPEGKEKMNKVESSIKLDDEFFKGKLTDEDLNELI